MCVRVLVGVVVGVVHPYKEVVGRSSVEGLHGGPALHLRSEAHAAVLFPGHLALSDVGNVQDGTVLLKNVLQAGVLQAVRDVGHVELELPGEGDRRVHQGVGAVHGGVLRHDDERDLRRFP